jgi:hypothetical protein
LHPAITQADAQPFCASTPHEAAFGKNKDRAFVSKYLKFNLRPWQGIEIMLANRIEPAEGVVYEKERAARRGDLYGVVGLPGGG